MTDGVEVRRRLREFGRQFTPEIIRGTHQSYVAPQRAGGYLAPAIEQDMALASVAVKPATHILYCNAGLGQLQYHNHQDDDHQHPDNDANDASVHFASVKFRGQQRFRSGRA